MAKLLGNLATGRTLNQAVINYTTMVREQPMNLAVAGNVAFAAYASALKVSPVANQTLRVYGAEAVKRNQKLLSATASANGAKHNHDTFTSVCPQCSQVAVANNQTLLQQCCACGTALSELDPNASADFVIATDANEENLMPNPTDLDAALASMDGVILPKKSTPMKQVFPPIEDIVPKFNGAQEPDEADASGCDKKKPGKRRRVSLAGAKQAPVAAAVASTVKRRAVASIKSGGYEIEVETPGNGDAALAGISLDGQDQDAVESNSFFPAGPDAFDLTGSTSDAAFDLTGSTSDLDDAAAASGAGACAAAEPMTVLSGDDDMFELDLLSDMNESTFQPAQASFKFIPSAEPEGSQWMMMVEDQPIAMSCHASSPEQLKAIYRTDQYRNTALTVLASNGLKEGAKVLGFQGVKVRVPMKSRIESEKALAVSQALASAKAQREAADRELTDCIATSAVAMNKGFYAHVKHPLKQALMSKLLATGMSQAVAANAIDTAFSEAGNTYAEQLIAQANEFAKKDPTTRRELASAIASASYQQMRVAPSTNPALASALSKPASQVPSAGYGMPDAPQVQTQAPDVFSPFAAVAGQSSTEFSNPLSLTAPNQASYHELVESAIKFD